MFQGLSSIFLLSLLASGISGQRCTADDAPARVEYVKMVDVFFVLFDAFIHHESMTLCCRWPICEQRQSCGRCVGC
jgi:hypothetical protein